MKKPAQNSDITTKIIKQFPNLFVGFLHKNINFCFTVGTFPNDFKKAMVHLSHKKQKSEKSNWKTEKSNRRLISILPNLSKIYIYKDSYMTKCILISIKCFVKHQCGFHKCYNDLSKAFYCLKHDLLIEKFHAFGFAYKYLRVI